MGYYDLLYLPNYPMQEIMIIPISFNLIIIRTSRVMRTRERSALSDSSSSGSGVPLVFRKVGSKSAISTQDEECLAVLPRTLPCIKYRT